MALPGIPIAESRRKAAISVNDRPALIKEALSHPVLQPRDAEYLEHLRRASLSLHEGQSLTPLRILISGGGICGLSTSIALSRRGHQVTVLEAADKIGSIGAGIQIASNATRQLYKWGLEDDLGDLIVHPKNITMRRWEDGRVISVFRLRNLKDRYGSPYVQLHRGDLHRSLYQIAEKHGVLIRTNAKAVDYDFEMPSLKLESGERLDADLIIAADGVRSTVRQMMEPQQSESLDASSYAAYRIVLDVKDVECDPELCWLVDEPHQTSWAGPDRHVQTYSMHANEKLNMVFIAPNTSKSRNPAHFMNELSAHFEGWDPSLVKLISMAENVGKWPIWGLPHMQKWSQGRVMVLGDAAHDMTPYLGQGAAMSIEDAVLLGEAMSAVRPDRIANDIEAAMELVQRYRKPRTDLMLRLAADSLETRQMPDGEEQEERDRLAAVELEGDNFETSPHIFTDPAPQRYIYGYDVSKALLA